MNWRAEVDVLKALEKGAWVTVMTTGGARISGELHGRDKEGFLLYCPPSFFPGGVKDRTEETIVVFTDQIAAISVAGDRRGSTLAAAPFDRVPLLSGKPITDAQLPAQPESVEEEEETKA